jgi:D-3-phosphoglycerate dehydrogenase
MRSVDTDFQGVVSEKVAGPLTGKRVLVTSSSFLDTPGPHRQALEQTGAEVLSARGPLDENRLRTVIHECGELHGIICGEDAFSSEIIKKLPNSTKVISKYGVGLDKIDAPTAQTRGISVTNTPGVNHGSVAELTFGLLLSIVRKIPSHNTICHHAEWKRLTGFDLAGKTLGIIGLGRVGKEVARRALAFNMDVLVFNTNWSSAHAQFVDEANSIFNNPFFSSRPHSIARAEKVDELLAASDFISLHMNLTKDNQSFLNAHRISACKRGVVVLNVSRGSLVDTKALADAIKRGHVGGYGADVVEPEPIQADNPLIGLPEVVLTPHIGSRTFDSVARQGLAAVHNLVSVITGNGVLSSGMGE